MCSITTERLTFRQSEQNDASELTRSINDWEIIRWLSRVPYPYRQTDAVQFIERSEIAWNEGNAFRFVIVLKTEIVGGIGLERHDVQLYELGFWIARQHWNKGIATEAVFEIIDFAYQQLSATRIIASCHEENQRSAQVLLKANFSRAGSGLKFSVALGKKVPEIRFFHDRGVAHRLV